MISIIRLALTWNISCFLWKSSCIWSTKLKTHPCKRISARGFWELSGFFIIRHWFQLKANIPDSEQTWRWWEEEKFRKLQSFLSTYILKQYSLYLSKKHQILFVWVFKKSNFILIIWVWFILELRDKKPVFWYVHFLFLNVLDVSVLQPVLATYLSNMSILLASVCSDTRKLLSVATSQTKTRVSS